MLPNVADQLGETLFDGKGMPGWFFTSNEVLEAEKDYFFRNSWLCIGLADDAKEPGDVYPVTILGQPLLVVRGRDAASCPQPTRQPRRYVACRARARCRLADEM